jgi:hypothetical protein
MLSAWAVEYERAEWWRELYDWRAGVAFQSHRLTGDRRTSSSGSSGSGGGSDSSRGSSSSSSSSGDGLSGGGGSNSSSGGSNGCEASGLVSDSGFSSGPGLSEADLAEMRFRLKRGAFQRALRANVGVRTFSSAPVVDVAEQTNDDAAATGAAVAAPQSTFLWMRTARQGCCEAMLTRFASWAPQDLRRKRLKVLKKCWLPAAREEGIARHKRFSRKLTRAQPRTFVNSCICVVSS